MCGVYKLFWHYSKIWQPLLWSSIHFLEGVLALWHKGQTFNNAPEGFLLPSVSCPVPPPQAPACSPEPNSVGFQKVETNGTLTCYADRALEDCCNYAMVGSFPFSLWILFAKWTHSFLEHTIYFSRGDLVSLRQSWKFSIFEHWHFKAQAHSFYNF